MTSNQPQLQTQLHSFDSPFQLENGPSPLPPLGPGPSLDHARSNSENRREPRSRTQSYMDAVRTGRGLLDDHVPPRSNTTVACSSQHILATALRRDPETSETMSLNAITIAFSLFPVGSRPTPSWLFTLPSPSIPPLKHRPAHRKSHQPMCPAEVDHLLFSPDGTHLLVCSHTSSTHPGLGHLRLSILVQSSSKADQWSLAWDEVVCDWSVRGVHERAPLEPHVKRVLKARFLGEPRRWFIDPAGPAVPEEESLSIGSTKYRKPQKTCGAPINGLTDGKGPTAILVLNTNELFVIHIPFRQSNLPPHVLLTTMSNSTIATGPLHLIPTPGSNRLDKKRTITQDTEQPLPGPPETVIAQLTRKAHEVVAQHVGLGFSVDSVPYPETIGSSSSFPSLGASHNGLVEFSILPLLAAMPHDTPGLETANPHGETSIQFNPNGYNQFEVSMNYFRSTRKEIVIAAIGFPAHLEHPDPNTEEPVLLIAFQTRTKPIIPTPVKQVVLPPSTQAPEGTADEGMQQDLQFSMAEDDYITGLGDLDDAFDMPTANKPSAPSLVTEEVGGEEKDEEANEASKRKAKSELRKEQHKRRRFEPISGIDESGDQAGAGGQAAYGFIDLVEIFVDFEDGVIPTISIQPLPSVPILDPADSTAESRVTIRSLDFIEPDIERGSEIQLLAGYSRELEESSGGTEDEKKLVDELQLWDVSHTRPELSSGFLGLECVGAHRKAQAVRGPPEWAFVRSTRKQLMLADEPGAKLVIRSLIPYWRARASSLLLFMTRAGTNAEGEEPMLELQVLNRRDLSEAMVKPMSSLTVREAQQIAVSYNGVWTCSVDRKGKVRALPLLTSQDSSKIVGMVMSAIYNREPIDDLVRLLSASVGDGFEHRWIFEQLSAFLAAQTLSVRNYEVDPLLTASMNVGHDLWSACPGYQPSAELALATRQLAAALNIGLTLKHDALARSAWPLLSIARWYLNLCGRIFDAADPDSKSPHLCLLPTTSCTFFYLFRLAMLLSNCAQAFVNPRLPSAVVSPPLPVFVGLGEMSPEEEYELGRKAFMEFWEHRNPLHIDSWGKCLQEFGQGMLPRAGADPSKLAKRQVEAFAGPLAAVDSAQVNDAVAQFRQVLSRYPQTMARRPQADSQEGFDIVTTARLDGARPKELRLCAKCGGRSRTLVGGLSGAKRVLLPGQPFDKFVGVVGPAEWAWTEYGRRCVCSGMWVSVPAE